jgi:phage tail P2-like protein
MADKRLIPPGIKDLNTETLNELIERLGTLDLTPLLVYIIDHVDASALPHLAWQFHIEGWELAQTEQEKRNLIKKAIELHRYKGTKWSVINALSAAGYDVDLKEWFEYQGNPYRFKAYVSNKPIQSDKDYQALKAVIDEYKNERSWLDSVGTMHRHTGTFKAGATVWNGKRYMIGINSPTFNVKSQQIYCGYAFRMGIYTTIGVQNG